MPTRLPLAAALLATLAGDATAACTCRYQGADRPLGTRVCLDLAGGPATYECGMVLNNTSWNKVADGCPQASLVPRVVAHAHAGPVTVAATGARLGSGGKPPAASN